MIRKLLFIVLLVLNSTVLLADINEAASENFLKADQFYKDGKYEEAAALYQEISDNGFESFEVYYNLGNAYYKIKNIPATILNYERALKLDPGDEDALFNLNVANLRIVDKIKPIPRFFLDEWLEGIRAYFSSDGWSAFMIIFIWAGFFSLAAFIISWAPVYKKLFFTTAVLCFIITAFSLVFAYQMNDIEKNRKEAVIFAPSVFMKSSPDEKSTKLVSLHEGTKVEVLDEVGEWKKVRLADGNIGWLPKEAIEII